MGQAPQLVHVCRCLCGGVPGAGRGWGAGGAGPGGRLWSLPAPARAWGPGGWPGASAHLCSCPASGRTLCYRILAFEGKSEHLAPLVTLVPWGSPRGPMSLAVPDNVLTDSNTSGHKHSQSPCCVPGWSKPLSFPLVINIVNLLNSHINCKRKAILRGCDFSKKRLSVFRGDLGLR